MGVLLLAVATARVYDVPVSERRARVCAERRRARCMASGLHGSQVASERGFPVFGDVEASQLASPFFPLFLPHTSVR